MLAFIDQKIRLNSLETKLAVVTVNLRKKLKALRPKFQLVHEAAHKLLTVWG